MLPWPPKVDEEEEDGPRWLANADDDAVEPKAVVGPEADVLPKAVAGAALSPPAV